MPKYEHDNWGDLSSYIFAKGIITDIDFENDLADVTVEGYQDGTDIPLFYHCSDDAEERDNGAIEGAAAAFSAGTEDDPEDGDEVIVMCEADTGNPVRIIGFVDGIKSCGFRFKIIREFDDGYIVTDAMSLNPSGYYYPDDFQGSGQFIWFKVYSNRGYQIVFYGHNSTPDNPENWNFYHPDEDIEDYNPECMATYDEDSQLWTVPIPDALKDPAGYLVMVNITDSIETQFLTPLSEGEEEPTDPYYPYVWKTGENTSNLPYVRQEYPPEDLDNEGYMNLAQPGTYDFPVPCHRNLGTTIDPVLTYGDVADGLPYKTTNAYFWAESYSSETTTWEGDLPCLLWSTTVNARIYPHDYPIPDPYTPPPPPDVEIVIAGPGLNIAPTNIIPLSVGSVLNVDVVGSTTISITLNCPTATFFSAYSYRFDALIRTNLVIDYT